MKLRFSINYNTQWGESLHIMITYTSSDGIEKSKNLLMNTEDTPFVLFLISIKWRTVMDKSFEKNGIR